MIGSVSSANVSQANAASQTTAPKPQQPQQTQQSTPLPSDTVSLKSTGDVDKDGDTK
jgi:hypothetical protein